LKLSDLLDSTATLLGDGDTEIGGICTDSRQTAPGDLFAALSGSSADGHLFIPEALAKGAVALMGGEPVKRFAAAVPVVLEDNPRLRVANMAARFHPGQPSFLAAVTGTNGKTSVASFTRQIWDLCGIRAASLGTLGVESAGRWPPTQLTTPDPVLLHRLCSQLADAGVSNLVVEASSHGLDQFRLDALDIAAAAFTNLSRDHFDYHGSAEAYFRAKRRLFDTLLRADGTAVLNADVEEFEPLRDVVRAHGIAMIDYGRRAERFRIVSTRAFAASQELTLEIDGRQVCFESSLVGTFQVSNLLAALGLAVAGGVPLDRAIVLLGQLRGAPGRMQLVASHACGAPAFVDYAHTPDALLKALEALRPHTKRQLHVVFGCGGDRDAGKRPVMGEIACRLADCVYVTDDNPRSEKPEKIRRQVLEACDMAKTVEVADRARAIREAFASLRRGDTLIVAGKGHEAGQTVGDVVLPFDDAQEIKKAAAQEALA